MGGGGGGENGHMVIMTCKATTIVSVIRDKIILIYQSISKQT